MANKFIIPSIFTAVDEMSPTVIAMRQNVVGFGNSAEASIAKADRFFRKLTPGIGAAQKQLLSMVGTGAALAGIFQLGNFSFTSLSDYEEAVDSFRTIVSDLNDTEFSKFQNEIDRVANSSKRSGTEVAQAFEKIAGLNAKFADTAEGIGQVSEATITLAKAAKMDLGIAAENLVGIMNQFSFGADQANRTINVLAAGQAVGAANITQTAEAFVNFGAVAAGANITLEESVGLVQTLGKFSLFSADAGTALKGSIVRLQKAGLGYASGQFNIIDALEQLNTILHKTKSAKNQDAILTKVFGAQQIVAGRILATNVQTFKEFTASVKGTSEAQKAAAINTGNLKTAGQELSAAWVNMITGTDEAKNGVNQLTSGLRWLAANLSEVVSTGISAVKYILLFKGGLLAAQGVMTAWNVTLGISSALQGASSIAMKANTTALAAQRVAMNLLNVSTEAGTATAASFSAVWAANPIGIIAIGVAALAAGIGYLAYKQGELNKEYERQRGLNITAHINAQSQATNALVKQWQAVGYATKEATLLALQYQVTQAKRMVSEAESKKTSADSSLVEAYDNSWFPAFSSDVSRVADEVNSAREQLTNAKATLLGATNAVIAAMNSGVISGSEGNKIVNGPGVKVAPPKPSVAVAQTQPQFAMAPGNKELIDEMNANIKANMTVTIKNDSDSSASVSSDRTKVVDVMPKTQSTKVLKAAYGN